MSLPLYDKLTESQDYLINRSNSQAKIGIVLGTGLGEIAQKIQDPVTVPYSDIPFMPTSTVESHAGEMIFGTLSNVPVVALSGRFHYYEGYSMEEVTYGIRLLKFLGIDHLLISNVAGGLQADMLPGDLVLIRDHINLMPTSPLRGNNDERLGPRFPDMLGVYDRRGLKLSAQLALDSGLRFREGVYAALPGPSLETPAEYGFLHTIGADVVGMSTVPEVIVARHMDLSVNAFSIVSNVCYPLEAITPTSVEEVIAVAQEATLKLSRLVEKLVGVLV
ncbi:MAG: purine-nucleoside phosphorylase [Saprospiraceae bacterium]|nr:purine-nucleoside phosphorylase [Saprospiraceae bacterium]